MPANSITFRSWFSPHAPRAVGERKASVRATFDSLSSPILDAKVSTTPFSLSCAERSSLTVFPNCSICFSKGSNKPFVCSLTTFILSEARVKNCSLLSWRALFASSPICTFKSEVRRSSIDVTSSFDASESKSEEFF